MSEKIMSEKIVSEKTMSEKIISGNIKEEKARLRKQLRGMMRKMPSEEAKAESMAICRQVMDLEEYRKADTVMAYVGSDWEIDTRSLLEDILKQGKTLLLPLCISDGIMEAKIVGSLDELAPGSYGIPEPPSSLPTCPKDRIDLMIVPCVACDPQLGRLGQGGGYYDRFMEGTDFTKAALCRRAAFVDRVPGEAWDLKMDLVVLSDTVYGKNRK